MNCKSNRKSAKSSTGIAGPSRWGDEPLIESLESRQLLSAVIEPAITISADAVNTHLVGYTAAEVRAAYGITGTGAGQTIAIVDAYNDPTIAADLKAFDAAMGIADTTLTVVSQTGSKTALPATDAGWALEIALDVEWAHAVAPGASILLVEAKSSSFSDLLTAVNYARNASGVSVVSMSWGSSEFFGETSYDSYFTTPAGHANVTFVAASGDDGYVTWPSVSANVLSVGGTALSLTSANLYSSESGWADSGGGVSRYVSEPSYQATVQSTGRRTTPDVSYDASPSTGFAVYDTTAYSGQSGWFEIGGTSAGAPQWAGIVALANAARASSGLATLSTSSVLSALYSTYNSSTYSTDFHDVTTGGTAGRFGKTATVGYDLVTGLGSPAASGVISTLFGSSAVASVTTTATTTTTTTTVTSTNNGDRHRFHGPFDAVDGSTLESAFIARASVIEAGDESLIDAAPADAIGTGFVYGGSGSVRGSAPTMTDFSARFAISADDAFGDDDSMVAGSRIIAQASDNISTNAAQAGSVPSIAVTHSPTVLLTTAAGTFTTRLVSSAADPNLSMAPLGVSIAGTVFGSRTTSNQEELFALSPTPIWTAAAGALAATAGFAWWWTEAERKSDQENRKKASPFSSSKLIESGPLY